MIDPSKIRRATLIGGVLTAVSASLCCIGPLMTMALGAGGFAASAAFEKWRPAFLGATSVLLALAWNLTFRKSKAGCGEGSACTNQAAPTGTAVVLWLATGAIVLLTAFPWISSAIFRSSPPSTSVVAADGSNALMKLTIPSMDCAACAVSIQRKLRGQAGVLTAGVSYAAKEAVIQYDPTKIVVARIVALVNETGFRAEVVHN